MTKEEVFSYVNKIREKAKEDYTPVMREGTAALLAELVAAKRPEQVLEIGTCWGVSAMTALAAGAVHLTTVEIDGDRAEKSRINFATAGLTGRVTQIVGDSGEYMRYLEDEGYDFIILDGAKSSVNEQFDESMRLVKRGGTIFVDDVEYHGMIKGEDSPHKHRTIIVAMRKFIERIRTDERVKVTFYDLEDGVAVIERIK